MCGITGIINPKDNGIIKKMTDTIRHRGPDDSGYFVDKHVALGMRRLSIIDLAKGKQPIISADGKLMIFFNGEIYNYKELRRELEDAGQNLKTDSDTEVILKMFEVYGPKMLKRLRGMFVFVIYNKDEHQLFFARDFFGIKPLYYWKKNNQIAAFSSEIKSFLALPDFKPEVNDRAVFNYLSFQYNPLEETFFKNVFKLPPAHYMVLDLRTFKIEQIKYWQFDFLQKDSLDEKETEKKVLEVMKDSVAHHMIADVPVGSFLSGGVDSSIIATLMQKIRGDKKIKTFTVGFESLSEGKEAKETSEPLGTDHTEIIVDSKDYFDNLSKAVWHFDEPVADPSAIGLFFLAREAAKHVKVVLSGEGSDELFGGYNIYLAPYAARKLSWLPKIIIGFLLKLPLEFFGKNYLRRVHSELSDWYIGNASVFKQNEIKKLWKGGESEVSLDSLYNQVSNLSDSTKMQYIDIHTWLVGNILAKADKMSMAHSLELRVPFLDIEVARLAATLPDNFKWKFTGWQNTTKYLLRKAFKNVLPESVRNRKKLGFPIPVKDWFTADKTEVYETILKNSYIKSHMNTDHIEKLISTHISQKSDNSRKIYLLLMLALWYNTFIDGHS